jgi:hypothetical protein
MKYGSVANASMYGECHMLVQINYNHIDVCPAPGCGGVMGMIVDGTTTQNYFCVKCFRKWQGLSSHVAGLTIIRFIAPGDQDYIASLRREAIEAEVRASSARAIRLRTSRE